MKLDDFFTIFRVTSSSIIKVIALLPDKRGRAFNSYNKAACTALQCSRDCSASFKRFNTISGSIIPATF